MNRPNLMEILRAYTEAQICPPTRHAPRWYERPAWAFSRRERRKLRRMGIPYLGCQHEQIEASAEDPDWGTCPDCGATGFPMTDLAAYGEVTCDTCKDMGIVPVNLPKRPNVFASAKCPDCRAGERP